MITIKVKQTKQDCLIQLHGHANYAPRGYDIVCSAISCLFETLATSVDRMSDSLVRYDDIDEDNKVLYIGDLDLASEYAIEFFRIGCKGVGDRMKQKGVFLENVKKAI